jgi:hypothetical protein
VSASVGSETNFAFPQTGAVHTVLGWPVVVAAYLRTELPGKVLTVVTVENIETTSIFTGVVLPSSLDA